MTTLRWLLACSAALACSTVFAQGAASPTTAIGYPDVATARAQVPALPGAEVRTEDGWTLVIIKGDKEHILWSFTPPDDPAYPAAVKRRIYEENGAIMLQRSALCEASGAACEDLKLRFDKLEQGMREYIRQEKAAQREKNARLDQRRKRYAETQYGR